MKKIILAMLAAVSLGTPAFADPIDEDEFFSASCSRVYVTSRMHRSCSRT